MSTRREPGSSATDTKASWRGVLANRLITLRPGIKFLVAASADAFVLALSAAVAVLLSTDPFEHSVGQWMLIALAPLMVIGVMQLLGAYRAVVRFIGTEFIERSALALLLATAALGVFYHPGSGVLAGRETLVFFGLLAFPMLLLTRLSAQRFLRPALKSKGGIKVLIYGAGDAGAQLASALQVNCQYRPVGFVDDRESLRGRTILGLPVYAPAELPALKKRGNFERILLAIPSVSRARRREILEYLQTLAVQVLVMPGIEELASGRKRVDELREVQIEDLLERDPVAPVASPLNLFIQHKSVLITGAGGSIGSELSYQALKLGARKLILFDVSEYALYRIDQELRDLPEAQHCEIVPVLASVLDRPTLLRIQREHAVETVYHAAAYKHVPLVEANVITAVRNNVSGTLNALETAIESGVRNFVLVSTDKAVRPTNVMGASKRVCELIVQAAAEQQPEMCLSMVRFGNVLASSGSVVPLFKEQIARGGPVTVTHPDVTRYFMTISEAAQLVIQAGSMGRRGEVFVLDMGQPVRIVDLARRMIHLSGLEVREPGAHRGDVEIHFTGLRPGEKLYEELLIDGSTSPSEHPRIWLAREAFLPGNALQAWLAELAQALDRDAPAQAIQLMGEVVDGFAARKSDSSVHMLKRPYIRAQQPAETTPEGCVQASEPETARVARRGA